MSINCTLSKTIGNTLRAMESKIIQYSVKDGS